MAKEFAALGAKRFLPTRLDMARRVGGLMRTAFEARLPLAHFSASGNVTQAPQPLNPVR
jgi:flagellar biosynthesis protein FlhF